MPKLTIDITDGLAGRLRAHPLALPIDHYSQQALDHAADRDAESRWAYEALAEVVRATLEPPRRSERDANELYSVPEVARMLRLSPDTVRRLIKAGELPITTVGRRPRISRRTISRIVDRLPEDDIDLTGVIESVRRARRRAR